MKIIAGFALLCLLSIGSVSADVKTNATPSPFITSVNQSGLDLYKQIVEANPDSNVLISPLSICAAFSLLAPGAKDKTLEEILTTFHWTGTPEALTDSVHHLLDEVLVRDAHTDSVRFEYGNSLWIDDDIQLVPSYDSLMRSIGAELATVDYVIQNGDSARRTMNAWTNDKTHGKIPEPVPPGVIDSNSIAVLMNALWMKMAWEKPFERAQTKDMPFYLDQGGRSKVSMMHRSTRGADAAFADLDGLQILELPVAGGLWSMQFFLPDSGLRLPTVEFLLSAPKVTEWQSQLKQPASELKIFLPKYKVEQNLSLKEPLLKLGMHTTFSKANLDRMFVTTPGETFIDDVLHSTFIEVTEQGFEAAAVTSIDIEVRSMRAKPLTFRADHPFFYTITHRETGLIVFCGRIMNPVIESD